MLQILVITLREGIEAFLIIAITAGILRQTGRGALLPALYWGTGVAVVASFVASVFFAQADNKPLWEGFLAAAAAIMVASMTLYMWKTARTMRATIGARIARATQDKPGPAAWWGVFFFVLLMIVREGMETALLLSTLFLQQGEREMLIGGLLGLTGAAAIAWAWVRYGRRVNLARFFQVTAIFLLLFSLQLVIYTFHEFFEAGVVPYVDNEFWHIATEPYGPEGEYGHWLTYSMVLIPAIWLAIVWLKDRRMLAAAH
ncbi:MAG TPA: FTR1 family protein [Casimicrobiaceae bacterium]|nr:FTR1 family protein [Casimicrobiaceae bacterium]